MVFRFHLESQTAQTSNHRVALPTLLNSDLAVSYIIYKNKIIRIMKENIIQAIVAKMQRDLDCRQMARLKAVLTSELHNVEIIEKSDCATQQTRRRMNIFLTLLYQPKR